MALLVIAVAALAVGAVLYSDLDLDRDDGPGRGQAVPIAAGSPPGGHRSVKREPDPLVPAEPVPDVPLTGTDSIQVKLRKPPRAGLLFDVRSGAVLWRRRPVKVLPMASLTKIMTALLVTERARPARAGADHSAPRCATRARASGCSRAGSACAWRR